MIIKADIIEYIDDIPITIPLSVRYNGLLKTFVKKGQLLDHCTLLKWPKLIEMA